MDIVISILLLELHVIDVETELKNISSYHFIRKT